MVNTLWFGFKPQPAALDGEPINAELKVHALGAEWEHHEAIALFHEWAQRFNLEFRLGLEVPVIAIDRMPFPFSRWGMYSSSTRWKLVPPKPKALTPARRTPSARAAHGLSSVLT